MKKIWITLVLVLIPTLSLGEEWILSRKQIEFGCDCQLNESEIAIKLGGGCSGNDYRLTEEGTREFKKNPNVHILSSWQEFNQFRYKYCTSPYFDTISKDFFNTYRLGIVYAQYFGSNFIKNDSLCLLNNGCGFTYEIWDRKLEAYPACTWSTLYLVKLKKSPTVPSSHE